MCGKMGVGMKCINFFIIRWVVKGLGDYVVVNGGVEMGVVIVYDLRYYLGVFV